MNDSGDVVRPCTDPLVAIHESMFPFNRLYRRFSEDWQADALCKGDVYVTTLATCRHHEDKARSDEWDGKRRYRAMIAGSSDDPENKVILERLGWVGASFENSIFLGLEVVQQHPDAYVLCSSVRYVPDALPGLGKFVVEMQFPGDFFHILAEQIRRSVPSTYEAAFSKVTYAEPEYELLAPEPGPIAFVKRPDPYFVEQEARMFFVPREQVVLKPRVFQVPALAELCRRVA